MGHRLFTLVLLVLAMSGCAYARLQNPATTDRATCGVIPVPLWFAPERARQHVFDEARCIEEYERRGYERVS